MQQTMSFESFNILFGLYAKNSKIGALCLLLHDRAAHLWLKKNYCTTIN